VHGRSTALPSARLFARWREAAGTPGATCWQGPAQLSHGGPGTLRHSDRCISTKQPAAQQPPTCQAAGIRAPQPPTHTPALLRLTRRYYAVVHEWQAFKASLADWGSQRAEGRSTLGEEVLLRQGGAGLARELLALLAGDFMSDHTREGGEGGGELAMALLVGAGGGGLWWRWAGRGGAGRGGAGRGGTGLLVGGCAWCRWRVGLHLAAVRAAPPPRLTCRLARVGQAGQGAVSSCC
jgi:hypothetical protein